MDRLLLVALFSLLATVSLLAAAPSGPAWNDNRYRDYDYNGGRYEEGARGRDAAKGGDDDLAPGPIGGTHTFQTRAECEEKCFNLCIATTVYLGADTIPMYACNKLKPPKAAPFFQTLKGNSFYLSLAIIGVIVVAIIVLLTMCACCSYCCRNPSSAESSRGSSKQALAHNEDGEFKEYLNGNGISNGNGHSHHHTDDIGAMKRERDFTRRPRPVPQIV